MFLKKQLRISQDLLVTTKVLKKTKRVTGSMMLNYLRLGMTRKSQVD